LSISEHKLLEAKLKSYFGSFLNNVDFIGLLFFYVGFILRFIPSYECYLAARIFLSFDILFWIFRSINVYAFIKSLGPKVLMIRKMAISLAYFCLIILVFMFAVGVSTQAVMYPNQELNRMLVVNVFFPAYFYLGGEFYTRNTIMSADRKNIFYICYD
jgi:hypothetical protein